MKYYKVIFTSVSIIRVHRNGGLKRTANIQNNTCYISVLFISIHQVMWHILV